MLYVSRSGIEGKRLHKGTDSKVLTMGRHHCQWALDTFEARSGMNYHKGRWNLTNVKPFKGVILIGPPGHGKTEFATHYLALEINANPRTQSQYLHAIDDKAEEHMAFVARLFDPGDEAGRRNISIFPDNKKILKKKSNIFELKLPERLKSPTITAAGVMSARLGGDTNIQVWDDIVPASDVDEPTTRERRSHRLGATFTTRQRGENTFILCIGYFFHHDDALSKLWKTSKKEPGIFYLSKQYTGGPTSTPRFASLWP